MSNFETTSEPHLEPAALSEPIWSNVVERIKCGDTSAMEDLYKTFSKGIRFLLYRRLGLQDLDDKVHDVFVIVVEAICSCKIRQPERLMGYVQAVVRCQVATNIDRNVYLRRNQVDRVSEEIQGDKSGDPERQAIDRQNMKVATSVLRTISKRDREVLTRFYLDEESADEICQAMDLSETQFRLIKSRAKARFGELGKRRLGISARPKAA